MKPFSAMLFDLDGTLVDTAPDLAFALNLLLEQQGKQSLAYELIRPVASHGSPALLALAFGIDKEHPDFPALQKRFIQIYQDNIDRESALFDGMEAVLQSLESADIPWGIVTNKPAFLTEPLVEKLSLKQRAHCIVSADTTPYSKPHPAPMLYACDKINIPSSECIYIGDAERDIQAGRNTQMQTVAALYGYVGANDDVASWQADYTINHPLDLLQWI
ncbi:MAG: phosphoglycolate phosphatase [Gammaproteobacteria bacterium]|nr:MAG: phosphoglycolate phosphatase [Gammaproteobacteria bacterium]